MAILFHGTTLYAVHGRSSSSYHHHKGRIGAATVKVYDGRNCGSPLLTVSGELTSIAFGKLRERRGDREAVQAYLASILEAQANV